MAKMKNRQRGATIVEAAIIFPVLILTMIGLLELGLVFKDFLTVSFAAREGARIGSLAGNDINADCGIVQGIVADLGADLVADGTITSIDIFRASPTTGDPIAGDINNWTFTGTDPTDCADWSTPVPEQWPSTSRNVNVGSTPLDILGVTINSTHDYITNVPPFGGSINLNETAIQRLEPEAFE